VSIETLLYLYSVINKFDWFIVSSVFFVPTALCVAWFFHVMSNMDNREPPESKSIKLLTKIAICFISIVVVVNLLDFMQGQPFGLVQLLLL
jgi:hypothetical protein